MSLATVLGALASASVAADLPPLQSPPSKDHFPGKFVWADLFTADPLAAQRFYTGLFGWTAQPIERVTPSGTHIYIVLSSAERPIAGIALRPEKMKDQVHGRWVGYVSVPDVPAALAAATTGGGRVLFPDKDLPQRGSQAVFIDSEGAILGLIHSTSGDPGEYRPEPGDWTWAELFSRDPQAAGRFYHGVTGWDVLPDRRLNPAGNFVVVSDGYSRAGLVPVPDRPKAHPAWLMFVRVQNVKDAAVRAVALGGRVLVAPADEPKEYWRAIVADPTGSPIGLVQLQDAPQSGAPPTKGQP